MTNIFVFYHHPCIDGTTAAWAAHPMHGDAAVYRGADHRSYREIGESLSSAAPDNTTVLFLDYAPPAGVLEDALKKGFRIAVYDHHPSSHDALRSLRHDNLRVVFDAQRSGAGIAWDIFRPAQKRPLLVDLVESIDLGRQDSFSSPDEYYTVAACLDRIDLRDFSAARARLDEISGWTIADFLREGRPHRVYYQGLIARALQKISYIHIEERKIPFIETDLTAHSRECVPRILEKENAEVAALWIREEEDGYRINLHSPGTAVAGAIAAHLKTDLGCRGGGHPFATVLRMDAEQFARFLEKYK